MKHHDHNPPLARSMLTIYIMCFLFGIASHARDFIIHYQATNDWRPYQWGVLPLEVFWTALIGFDAAVIGLLAAGYRRSGLLAAILIMTLDVGANSYALFSMGIRAFTVPLVLQMAFFGFVLGSIPFLWPNHDFDRIWQHGSIE